MPVATCPSSLPVVNDLRERYRAEMNCQIIHDSIHRRPGWTQEFELTADDKLVGYGSVAIAGPWQRTPALYEFYVESSHRTHSFALFEALLARAGVRKVETQSNDPFLTPMLHTYCSHIATEYILFVDGADTSWQPDGAEVREATEADEGQLQEAGLDEEARWLLTSDGVVAGAGGVLYHYNPPYGDIYMEVVEAFRRRGLGAFLVQELKKACRASGKFPGARCRVDNVASRRTLQKAGFVPCGNLITGRVREERRP